MVEVCAQTHASMYLKMRSSTAVLHWILFKAIFGNDNLAAGVRCKISFLIDQVYVEFSYPLKKKRPLFLLRIWVYQIGRWISSSNCEEDCEEDIWQFKNGLALVEGKFSPCNLVITASAWSLQSLESLWKYK